MSGCCGQGPVIISGSAAATPRVDVEAVLLCDVLADGTVAGLALVEPIYDTNTGARVGTRIVDPTTGATYTPAGTLGVCGSPSDQCARQISTRTRCDDTNADGTGDVTYVEVWALDPCDGGAPQLLGAYRDGDFAQPYTPTAPADCPDATADTPVVLGTVCYDAGGGATRTAAVLKCAACGDPAVTYLDTETGATLTAPAIVPCPAATDRSTQLLCDVQADGSSVPFLRTFTSDGTTTSTADTRLDGVTAYSPTGTVGVCLPVNDCASPTTPTTTVGLCLADGTPIAVTVVRDCNGAVTSEGWINLTTGTFSAGAPPAGTIACGDSRSIQVSGTFCDVDQAGDVVGLVLVEYKYAADGSIESVRLVDATTGQTYTPQGTITVCPSGTEQPEQDLAVLCDVAADGTVTAFTRDFRRDEAGAIVGFSDYTLAGAAYTPTGTVGVCDASTEEIDHLQLLLCDTATDGTVTQFLRHWTVDNSTGTLTAAGDTLLDGTTAYTPGGSVGACESCARQVIERCGCDDTDGDGVGDVTYTELWAVDPCGGGAPELLGTYLDGDLTKPYTPIAPVECTAADQPPGPLSTGVRSVTGTAVQDLAGTYPGLQSVSLAVLSDRVLVTMSDGASVPVPAGASLTWSVEQEADTALAAASFAGASAAASYLLNWTYR
ncbi:hypothetical protein AQJ11_03180 [Streptomyces corchorusii]|uniref:Uncharacterized protein n=2 Tax=Streptomyces TaxID=1883 RepID=A0A117QJZ2_STRCK|nr:hypothetical protein [Streptomyces corchorusii]KUN32544.1 hypothetical protein AQJ11_03180 [Streptomyces corchorusii]